MNLHNTILLNLNPSGLKNQINTLFAFLNHHIIDIACKTETHLTHTDKIKFPGYKIYRKDSHKTACYGWSRYSSLQQNKTAANFYYRFALPGSNSSFDKYKQ